jgi:hypothetical protein
MSRSVPGDKSGAARSIAGTANPQGAVHTASKKMAPVMRTECSASDNASMARPPPGFAAKKRRLAAKVAGAAASRLQHIAPKHSARFQGGRHHDTREIEEIRPASEIATGYDE